MKPSSRSLLLLALALLGSVAALAAPADEVALVQLRAAARVRDPQHQQYLGAARAGERLVAVGERGAIALSDDGGRSFRQAASVPVQATLTAVQFVDAKTGFAVGHWGVILGTQDAGETWTLRHSDTAHDRPLFSVYFQDPLHGWAVGLWGLMLGTQDAGKTWQTLTPTQAAPGAADRNLYAIFGDGAGSLFVTSERGVVLRSSGAGQHWDSVRTGYSGSLWSGLVLRGGVLLVAGLRGSVYRSTDAGLTWKAAQVATHSSITSMLQLSDGSVVASALDGVELRSTDLGQSFESHQRADRSTLNSVLQTGAGQLLWLGSRELSLKLIP